MAKNSAKKTTDKKRARVLRARIFAVLILLLVAALCSFIFALIVEKTDGFGTAEIMGTAYRAPVLKLPSPQGGEIEVPIVVTPDIKIPEIETPDNSAWNFIGEVEKTINVGAPIEQDARMLCVPENTRADESYFAGVTFLGDSVTQGMKWSTTAAAAKICGYKSISLKQVYDGSIHDNGAGAKEAPLAALAATAPQAVYVMLGHNSYIAYPNDDAYLAYYDEMVAQIIAAVGPDVLVYLQSLTPTVEGTPRFDLDRIHRLNNGIAEIAYKYNVYYIDLHEALAGDNGYLLPEYGASDGYHLTRPAYNVWAEYILTHTVKVPDSPIL